MRHLGGNADHIARGKLLPDAALNGSVTLLMRLGVFRTHQDAPLYKVMKLDLRRPQLSRAVEVARAPKDGVWKAFRSARRR
jgi:hypothetical protein